MFNKPLEDGHIVAVRYVWNSYIGVMRLGGLMLTEGHSRFFSGAPMHAWDSQATYQILGHMSSSHDDYDHEVFSGSTMEKVSAHLRLKFTTTVDFRGNFTYI